MTIINDVLWLVQKYKYLFYIGITNTLFIWLMTVCISGFFGLAWGIMREKKLFSLSLCAFFNYFAYLIISIPLYIQLLLSTFVIYPFFGIRNIMFIGISTLGICSASYTSQMVQTSMTAVGDDQWELARMLGYSKFIMLRDIILPQVFHTALPLFINECDQILKSISLLSTIGILDITRASLNIINITFDPVPVYAILLVIYLLCSFLLRYFLNKFFMRNSE